MVVFHTLVCVLLVIVVLMQSSKGEGLAGAFGGGGSGLTGAVFGGRGAASFLSKATTVLAIVFMINCGVLAFISSNRAAARSAAAESAVTEQARKEVEQQAAQQQVLPTDSAGVMNIPTEESGENKTVPPPPTKEQGGQ
jgi:preprotein translocase subunit SecG